MDIEAINISEIQRLIDNNLGSYDLVVPSIDENVIKNFLASAEFNAYLQDKIYQWVIKSYLVNIKLHGTVKEDIFNSYLQNLHDKKEDFAISIILSSLPFADNLNILEYMKTEPVEINSTFTSVLNH